MSLCAMWMRIFVLFLDVSLCCVDEDFCSVSRCHFLLCCMRMVTVQPFPDVTICRVADDFLFCFQIHLMGLKITGQVPAVSCLHLHIHHPSCPAALTTHSPHPTYITQKWWVVGWFACWSGCEFCALLLCMHYPEMVSCGVVCLLVTLWVLCPSATYIMQIWWLVWWFICCSLFMFCAILHASARIDELCGDSFAAHVVSFLPSCMHHAETVSCAVIHLLLALRVLCHLHPAYLTQGPLAWGANKVKGR